MKRVILYSILLISTIVSSAVCMESGWIHIAPNNYVYEDGIMGTENRYGYSFLLKSYNKGQYEPINGRQILYTLSQYEIDCSKRMYKIGLMDSYDDNGFFISGDYNKYAQFQPIVEGTAVYEVANKLCKL